jgi:hypothetical protein
MKKNAKGSKEGKEGKEKAKIEEQSRKVTISALFGGEFWKNVEKSNK